MKTEHFNINQTLRPHLHKAHGLFAAPNTIFLPVPSVSTGRVQRKSVLADLASRQCQREAEMCDGGVLA